MPIHRCKAHGKYGWQWGNQKCYIGLGALAKAKAQAKAIHSSGYAENYNPNQPRDERGRWGSGGSGGVTLAPDTGVEIGGGGSNRPSLKQRPGFDYLDPVSKPDPPRPYIAEYAVKDMHPECERQMLETLDRLVDKYGVPSGGIKVTTMSGGNSSAVASAGKLTAVTPERARELHATGEHILDMRIGKTKTAQYYHDDRGGVTISVSVTGPRGGKGNFALSPDKFEKRYEDFHTSLRTGRGVVDDIVTHEFGHTMAFRAGWSGVQGQSTKANTEVAKRISGYAFTNQGECIAEAFKYYDNGGRDPVVVKFIDETIFSRLPK